MTGEEPMLIADPGQPGQTQATWTAADASSPASGGCSGGSSRYSTGRLSHCDSMAGKPA